MEPIDVYLMYCAMKAHFHKSNYDYVKYKGKTRISRDTFYKRKDRGFFVRLSRKYKSEEEIKNYFLSNFIKDRKGYIANFNDENYHSWKLKRSNFFDMFVVEMTPFVSLLLLITIASPLILLNRVDLTPTLSTFAQIPSI